jgi:hypothetical protein
VNTPLYLKLYSYTCYNMLKFLPIFCIILCYASEEAAVTSAFLFPVYKYELLLILKNSEIGCYIDSVFYGAFIFADDTFILSASRSGLQSLVKICQEFASQKNLKFETTPNPEKSKQNVLCSPRNPRILSILHQSNWMGKKSP